MKDQASACSKGRVAKHSPQISPETRRTFPSSETSVSSEESEKEFSSLPERKFRILVVDDNENIRDMLEDFLNFEGHKPVLARDGEEALQIFSEQDFDFVITDLGMPGMSGWELTNHIKQRKPEIPVAIITGWGAQLGVEDLKEHKVEWILSKPFRLDQVKQLVERFAGRLSEQRKVSRPSE